MAKVTATSTKDAIMLAYNETIEELKEARKENTALRQETEKKQRLLEQAGSAVKAGASLSVAQLRQGLNEQLEQLEKGLAEEQKKFEMLREATAEQQSLLDNLFHIKAEAESLEALALTNRTAKERLELEMETRRQQLTQDIAEVKTKWEREQEEYVYNLKLKRRNEEDLYKEQKAKLDKDLAERKLEFEKNITLRERAVAEQEEEFKRLHMEVEAFDPKLQKAVADAEKSLGERLTKEFEYQKKLEIKDLEAQLKLHEQMIQSLQNRVKEQQEHIVALSAKTDNAGKQVQDIALKAIEKSGVVVAPMEQRRSEKDS